MDLSRIKGAEIHCADSAKLIKTIPDASVDLILTDPPYNLGNYSTGNIKLDWRADFNNDIAAWDNETFDPAAWLHDFKRILKPTGNIFAFTSYNQLGDWHRAFDSEFDTFQFMVWHKTNPAPKLRKAGFLNSCELIVAMWNKGHTWNFGKQNEMHNFIQTPICMGRERLKNPKHPTQKPVAVLEHILKIASKPGDLVFDPFMGVGSTGVAALKTGRKFLGADKALAYVKASKTRIETLTGEPMLSVGHANRRKSPVLSSDILHAAAQLVPV
ncbi:MAG: site-specific DNA-methyltransferase [Hyphomicrobiaceae bacterium]|nr:site-specific DNA-methyltransferase [Hyphomicrobiaceae bacterium]